MDTPLQALQSQMGAVFAPEVGLAVPLSYGNDDAAYGAARSGVALVDRSHWGRLRVSDRDHLRFLHNQTTNQLQTLQAGHQCDTVFVTPTGRTLDLATAYVDDGAVVLLVSPGQAAALLEWMDRYVFFADKVQLTDETETTVTLTLIGPESANLLQGLGLSTQALPAAQRHILVDCQGISCRLAAGSGLGLPGYTLTAAAAEAAPLWSALIAGGAIPLGEKRWEQLRLEQGRPIAGAELTADYNPLEAGLWAAVSFDKGCYIGQETIARLQTYQGVKQQLWGLSLSDLVPSGTEITHGGVRAGRLTSVMATPTGVRGLGYLRTKVGGAGLTVEVGTATATVLEIPFVSRGYLTLGAN
ncbi:YgfZ/GcvT domain-containing protein [Leptolyngbya sp. PCC 6406]|uniref:CAF17-like 4Fe-4S cluster assembly/insertion protein YgfZ n=1 Tax=Leptolyngbya sp. PCC 6406 TaxID=1173264 RepID=UPI0002ABE639|nr:folate-binding protein YgfZ [Leptolyngbya sp. PCC 6406]